MQLASRCGSAALRCCVERAAVCHAGKMALPTRTSPSASSHLRGLSNCLVLTPSQQTARSFCSTPEKPTETKAEEAAADKAEEKPTEEQSATDEQATDSQAPDSPTVLFTAPSIRKDFDEAVRQVNMSAAISALGLGSALLGVAPFTPPNAFCFALMLAVVQVRLAHVWQTRMLRSHVRRHVEEIIQHDEGSIEIKSGNLTRKLQLSAATAAGEKPQLNEVLEHGGPFVFIDQKGGKIEADSAFEAMLQSDRAITREDLDIKTFDGEHKQEADKVVQPLSKITSKDLPKITKQAKGMASPQVAISQTSRSAFSVSGVILIGGGIIGVAGSRQEDANYQSTSSS